MNYLFGIDIGGTTIKMGVADYSGNLIDKYEITTDVSNNGSNILSDICKSLVEYLQEKKIDYKNIKGIGFGIPGPVKGNFVEVCPNIGWKGVNVEEEFLKLLPFKTKIACGNDANVAAFGEASINKATKGKNVVMLTLGTGVGGGVIINGLPLEGVNGAAGELGHMPVDNIHNFKCNCGNFGCLETVASATGVVHLAKEYLKDMPSSLKLYNDFECKDVFNEAKNGDALSLKVVDEVGAYLGKATALISAVLNPDAYIIGGGVSKAGNILIDSIEKHYKNYVFSPMKNTEFMLATLGNEAGMIGAALLAKMK